MEVIANKLFMLISKKKNDEVKDFLSKNGIDIKGEDKRTPLIHAAFYNNTELMEWLLENKADINAADRNGYTALHFACEKGYNSAVKLLISKGANLNKPDFYGNTPAWIAITYWKQGQNLPILRELYQHNANLSIKNNAGYSALDILPTNIMNAL